MTTGRTKMPAEVAVPPELGGAGLDFFACPIADVVPVYAKTDPERGPQ
jgi:hypothetical protein